MHDDNFLVLFALSLLLPVRLSQYPVLVLRHPRDLADCVVERREGEAAANALGDPTELRLGHQSE